MSSRRCRRRKATDWASRRRACRPVIDRRLLAAARPSGPGPTASPNGDRPMAGPHSAAQFRRPCGGCTPGSLAWQPYPQRTRVDRCTDSPSVPTETVGWSERTSTSRARVRSIPRTERLRPLQAEPGDVAAARARINDQEGVGARPGVDHRATPMRSDPGRSAVRAANASQRSTPLLQEPEDSGHRYDRGCGGQQDQPDAAATGDRRQDDPREHGQAESGPPPPSPARDEPMPHLPRRPRPALGNARRPERRPAHPTGTNPGVPRQTGRPAGWWPSSVTAQSAGRQPPVEVMVAAASGERPAGAGTGGASAASADACFISTAS